jgi:uncharacterized membrane protein YozB (DUF420 family)
MDAQTLAAILPAVNATLNGMSGLLLVAGYVCIRRKCVAAHRCCMLSAFGVSVLFLGSYLTLRSVAGMTRFMGEGWIRPVYFTILVSHTVLAVLLVPTALLVLREAVREHFARHVRWARVTLPMWVYVSVSGVLVYLILYHLAPAH